MTFSEIKIVDNFRSSVTGCEYKPFMEEFVDQFGAGSADFTIDADGEEYRFIHVDEIDQIQCKELESDLYILGCFVPAFLSGILGCPEDCIRLMQEKEACEAIGNWIIEGGYLHELQIQYASADGYGHHFSSYDGEENDIEICGEQYLAFRVG